MGPCTNNSGGSRGEARKACLPPPLLLHQTKARRAEKIFFGDRTPLLSKGLDERPPSLSQGLDPTLNKIHYSTQY